MIKGNGLAEWDSQCLWFDTAKAVVLKNRTSSIRKRSCSKITVLLLLSLLSIEGLVAQRCANVPAFALDYNTCGSVVIVNTTQSRGATQEYEISWGDGMSEAKVIDWDTFYHTYSLRKLYSIKLEMLDTAGCRSDTTLTIKLPAEASLAFTSTHICQGDTYAFPVDTLRAKNLDSVVQFIIDYGDSSKPDTSTTFNFRKVYNKANLYRVTVDKKQKVLGKHCVDKDYPCPQITVYPEPTPEFDAPDTVYVKQRFFLIDFSVLDTSTVVDSIVQFHWSFGDGNTYSAKKNEKVSYAYQKPGVYDITLTVITKEGACSQSFIKPIVVCPKPILQFTAATPCEGLLFLHKSNWF